MQNSVQWAGTSGIVKTNKQRNSVERTREKITTPTSAYSTTKYDHDPIDVKHYMSNTSKNLIRYTDNLSSMKNNFPRFTDRGVA